MIRPALATLAVLALVSGCDEHFEFDVPEAGSAAGTGGTGGTGGTRNDAGASDASDASDASRDRDAANDAAEAGSSSDSGARCSADSPCPLETLHCEQTTGACVECTEDAHCAALGLKRCDSAAHRCVACGLDQDCGTNFACEPYAHACVKRCAADIDCGDPQLECDLLRGLCVDCDDVDDCSASSTTLLYCAPGGSRCVECRTDASCSSAAPHCDPIRYECVVCRDSRDCAAPSVCDPTTHECR